jgi:hypothetical protein
MKHHGIWRRKYRDVMTCQFCHRRLWKDDEMPDFMIVWQGCAYLVECKQSTTYWNFTDADGEGIRHIQRREMDRWEAVHNPCFLFLTLGSGRAPGSRSAWIIPWSEWKTIETTLTRRGQHSLARVSQRNVGALDLLKPWELSWSRGKWVVPPDHVFRQIVGGIYETEVPAA